MCHCEGQDLQEAVQSGTGCRNQRILIQNKVSLIENWDQFRFLGNCPPTPPLSHYFAQNEKQVLMLAQGRSRWVVSQKPKLIRNLISDIENKRVLSLGQCRNVGTKHGLVDPPTLQAQPPFDLLSEEEKRRICLNNYCVKHLKSLTPELLHKLTLLSGQTDFPRVSIL